MATLLVTLEGPMQSWGTSSKFSQRSTDPAPSKSGVLGLVAAARGLRRTEPLTELTSLRFGVRSDQPGQIMRDFQTARTLDGKSSMPLSNRYYLGDAVFLAALEHTDSALLHAIQLELQRPVFPLYLGRRSCPPAGPVRTELVDECIEEAFEMASWRAKSFWRVQHHEYAQISLETRIDRDPNSGSSAMFVKTQDMPMSFAQERRSYGWRDVTLGHVSVANPDFRSSAATEVVSQWSESAETLTDHDVLGDWPEGNE